MSIEWYSDRSAMVLHQVFVDRLRSIMTEMTPDHELSHLGVHRNPVTDEVILKLHLNPTGRVRVNPNQPPPDQDNARLPR